MTTPRIVAVTGLAKEARRRLAMACAVIPERNDCTSSCCLEGMSTGISAFSLDDGCAVEVSCGVD